MPGPNLRPFKGFDDPLQVVDRTDIAYGKRLAILQEWQSMLSNPESSEEERNTVNGAISALEMGAVVQDDAPQTAPEHFGYGKPRAGG